MSKLVVLPTEQAQSAMLCRITPQHSTVQRTQRCVVFSLSLWCTSEDIIQRAAKHTKTKTLKAKTSLDEQGDEEHGKT